MIWSCIRRKDDGSLSLIQLTATLPSKAILFVGAMERKVILS